MILIRSILYNAYFWLVTAAMALGSLPIRFLAPRFALGYGRIWARAVLAGLGPLAGVRVAVLGAERLPQQGPALIASQHQSAFDTLIWLLLVPRPAYVLKRELEKVPFYGPMLRPAGQIAIDRHGGASALGALLRAAERAVAERRQIVIFPEGTRVAPGKHGVVQPGVAALAQRTGLPVIPVATDSGRIWGRRAFRKHPGTIHIVIGEPLAPNSPRREVQQALARFYQRSAAGATKEPVDNLVDGAHPRFEGGRNDPLHSSE